MQLQPASPPPPAPTPPRHPIPHVQCNRSRSPKLLHISFHFPHNPGGKALGLRKEHPVLQTCTALSLNLTLDPTGPLRNPTFFSAWDAYAAANNSYCPLVAGECSALGKGKKPGPTPRVLGDSRPCGLFPPLGSGEIHTTNDPCSEAARNLPSPAP